ncbi:hypothetical protein [Streptomyces sp. NPDC055036]
MDDDKGPLQNGEGRFDRSIESVRRDAAAAELRAARSTGLCWTN